MMSLCTPIMAQNPQQFFHVLAIWKLSVHVFYLFKTALVVFELLSFLSCLCVLDINSLSYNLQIFPLFCWCIFTFLNFLCNAATSSLDVIPLVYFCFFFFDLCFWEHFEEVFAYAIHWGFPPEFSSSNSIISGHEFRSMINFDGIFV